MYNLQNVNAFQIHVRTLIEKMIYSMMATDRNIAPYFQRITNATAVSMSAGTGYTIVLTE